MGRYKFTVTVEDMDEGYTVYKDMVYPSSKQLADAVYFTDYTDGLENMLWDWREEMLENEE